ncbi:MAG TPA: carbon storage regulator [Ktedonobacterales bacterium]|nr:carbon storage regulator [Ktedonobacterales bacterium]
MLVLRRKAGEAIVLNGTITIHVLAVEGERVKLGINAPPEVVIVRSELLEGQASNPASSMPGAPVPPRESRPSYSYRDPNSNGQRPYRNPEENDTSGETPGPGRPPMTGMNGTNGMNGVTGTTGTYSAYSGQARYAPRRRMYEDPNTPTPLPNPNPRYR